MSDNQVTRDTTIEEIVEVVPQAVGYLREQGIRCILCGEPAWGTLADAAQEKGFGDDDIERFVREINALPRG